MIDVKNPKELKEFLNKVAQIKKELGEEIRDGMAALVNKLDEAVESGIFGDGEAPYAKQVRVLHSNMNILYPPAKAEDETKE